MGSGDWGCSETAGKCSDTVVRRGTILDGSLAFLPHTVKKFFVFFFFCFVFESQFSILDLGVFQEVQQYVDASRVEAREMGSYPHMEIKFHFLNPGHNTSVY